MIETALGPIDAASLGATSMHEHLLADARVLHREGREPRPANGRVTIENLGYLRWNLLGLEDNLVLDDAELAVAELSRAHAAGQAAVVDLTSWGLEPQPARLAEISRDTGMHIVVGCGAYLGRSHPEWVARADTDVLAERFIDALEHDYEGCGYRAGLLGLIGTSEPIDGEEVRVLQAVGAAVARTGTVAAIRLDPAARRGPEVLGLLSDSGCPADHVIFCNVDEFLELDYLEDLGAAGATLEWCFGNEAYYGAHYKDPTDAERLRALIGLLERDPALIDRCVLACSVWTKTQLRAFGGMGYDHLLTRIVPALRRAGLDDEAIDTMLVRNPARLLDR